MNLQISGWRKDVRQEVKDATLFFGKQLMPRMWWTFYIEINLIYSLDKKEGIDGDVVPIDDEYRPKEFLMRLNPSYGRDHLISTLAHEMVHIKQFARMELYDLRCGKTRWKKSKINPDKVKYEHLPWEKEAEKLGASLFDQWKCKSL
jgi:hypothetical protein